MPKKLAREIVATTIENEFGTSFTYTSTFAKMVDTLGRALTSHPELRNELLKWKPEESIETIKN